MAKMIGPTETASNKPNRKPFNIAADIICD